MTVKRIGIDLAKSVFQVYGVDGRERRVVRKRPIHAARALMRHLKGRDDPKSRWVIRLTERRGFNKAVIALVSCQERPHPLGEAGARQGVSTRPSLRVLTRHWNTAAIESNL